MIVIRHARPVVNDAVLAADWELSEEGHAAAVALGKRLHLNAPVRASTERKAMATAEALAFGPVTPTDALCEVRRPWYSEAAALEADAKRWFHGESVEGWESITGAIDRFRRAVLDTPPVIVTHGTVFTAWLGSVAAIDDLLGYWIDLRQPDAWHVDALTGSITRV